MPAEPAERPTKPAAPAAAPALKAAAKPPPKAAVKPPPNAGRPRQPKSDAPPTPMVEAAIEAAEPPAPVVPKRRVWVTGGSGFIGRAVVRHLVARGDDVTVPLRDRRRVADLVDLDGATLLQEDLTDVRRLAEALREADSVIHAAGSYRVGISRSERGAMWDANIGTTTRVLDAAEAAGVARTVYVSTVAAFGNTHGLIVDETHRRDLGDGFSSWYDETKYGAHEVAQQRATAGAPVLTVLPSQVYGPADHSAVGDQLRLAYRGQLRYRALDDVGLGLVHVDDLAAGILAALDQGGAGQSYVLSGPTSTLGQALAIAARLGGHGLPPRIPTGLLRAVAPLGRLVGQPNLAETISAGAGVTYWASSAKAAAQLGFVSRGIEDGLRATFGLPAAD